MSRFGITARFPLGVFQGHYQGRAEPVPSPARLHAALLAAASKGSLGVEREGDLRASGASLRALEWIEAHPPVGVTIPPSRSVRGRGSVLSYRAEGVMDAANGALRPRVVPKGISDGFAVSGPFGWVWEDVPDDVAATIRELCEDVPVLGETDSPVVLEAAVLDPTLVLDSDAGELSARGHGMPTPIEGRARLLEDAYEAANPRRRPSAAQDAFSQSQLPSPSPIVVAGTTELRYIAPDAVPPVLPWTEALIFPVKESIPEYDRVRWCVTFHRAIAKIAPGELPASLTGKYPQGVTRPANRVAIHYVPADKTAFLASHPGAFVVLLPATLAESDKAMITSLLSQDIELYAAGTTLRTRVGLRVAADEFWRDPPPGTVRWWQPVPALVAEARRQPHRVDTSRWTLRDSACLSLGFAFRDAIDVPARDYRDVVAAVRSHGVDVVGAHLIADSRVERYAHKLPEGLVAQPFWALIRLGDLASDQTILAVGQSRHLGGGLLTPVDLSGQGSRSNNAD